MSQQKYLYSTHPKLAIGLAQTGKDYFFTSELLHKKALEIAEYLISTAPKNKNIYVDSNIDPLTKKELRNILGRRMEEKNFGKRINKTLNGTSVTDFSGLDAVRHRKILFLVAKETGALIPTNDTPKDLQNFLLDNSIKAHFAHYPSVSSSSSPSISIQFTQLTITQPVAGGYAAHPQQISSFYNTTSEIPFQAVPSHTIQIPTIEQTEYLYRDEAKKEIYLSPDIPDSILEKYVQKYPNYLYFLDPKTLPVVARHYVNIFGKALFSCGEFPLWDGEDYMLFAQSFSQNSRPVLLKDIQDQCAKLIVDHRPPNCTLAYHRSCAPELVSQIEYWRTQREERERIEDEAAERELMLAHAAAERKSTPSPSSIYAYMHLQHEEARNTREKKQQYALQNSPHSPQMSAIYTTTCSSTISSEPPSGFFSQRPQYQTQNALSSLYSVPTAESTSAIVMNKIAATISTPTPPKPFGGNEKK